MIQHRSGRMVSVMKALRSRSLALLREWQVRRAARAAARAPRRRRGAHGRRLLHEPHRPGRRPAGRRSARGRPALCSRATPLAREYFDRAAAAAACRPPQVSTFPSVVLQRRRQRAHRDSRGVGRGYPLRGKLKVADVPFGPAQRTDAIPGPGEVWLDSRLLAQLGASVGDRVRRRRRPSSRVTHVLDYRPDQGSQFADLAPTLLMRLDDLPATELIAAGSRWLLALFAGERTAGAAVQAGLAQRARSSGERLVDVDEASPQIQSAVDRAGRFLNLRPGHASCSARSRWPWRRGAMCSAIWTLSR